MIPQPSPGISRLPARGSVAERYVRSRSREVMNKQLKVADLLGTQLLQALLVYVPESEEKI
jgi:hypothetical protein